MERYKITAEMNLQNLIKELREVAEALSEFADYLEPREVAQALSEFADNLERIEKKYAKPQESEGINDDE